MVTSTNSHILKVGKKEPGPTTPVIIGDLLYGRGGADDGYAIYSSVICIK